MAGRYALIVASGTYRDSRLSRLRTPTRDAEELARVLGDPAIGDFEVELSRDEPEAALRRRIAAFFADRTRDDLLLLHFSCHGLKDDSGQLYFAATDTEVAHLDATAVSAEFVSRQMTRTRSRQVVALLDCCYSGAVARGLRFRAGDTVQLDDHLGGRGRVILTASSAMEYAFEGDELTGSGSPSVFTSAVVKGLETGEADRDQDHRISIDELYDYVCEQVREVTPDQSPNMLSHLEGELYLARSTYEAPVDPADLPAELRAAIQSPFAGVREGAVTELARIAGGPHPREAAAARAALAELGQDDSRRVGTAATAALTELAPAHAAAPLAPAPAPAPRPREAPDQGAARGRARPAPGAPGAMVAAAVGALLLVSGLATIADRPDSGELGALAGGACAATVIAGLLVLVPRLRRGWLATSGADAAALAAFALGVGLAAERLSSGSEWPSPTGLIVTGGGLLVAGAALWQARDWAPPPRAFSPLDALLVTSALVLALASFTPWAEGERPAGMLLAGLVLAVLVASVAGLAGVPSESARRLARRSVVAAPAAGAFVVGATLTVARRFGETADEGAKVAFYSGVALLILAAIRIVRSPPDERLTPAGREDAEAESAPLRNH